MEWFENKELYQGCHSSHLPTTFGRYFFKIKDSLLQNQINPIKILCYTYAPGEHKKSLHGQYVINGKLHVQRTHTAIDDFEYNYFIQPPSLIDQRFSYHFISHIDNNKDNPSIMTIDNYETHICIEALNLS